MDLQKYMGYFIIAILLMFSIGTFLLLFFKNNKNIYLKIYGKIFMIFSFLLYLLSLNENIENQKLKTINFTSLYKTLEYYFLWILLPFWIFPITIIALFFTFIFYLINIRKQKNKYYQ